MIVKKVNMGIIGFGNIALHHALAILWNKDANLYAICDTNQERLDLAKEWGAKKTYKDYADLLKDPAVDAVDICVHPAMRAEIAVASAEAKKHLITEKPMCNSLAEADTMIGAASMAGVKFMHAESYVFTTTHIKARETIEEGAIGKPLYIRENFGGWRRRDMHEYVYGHRWPLQPRLWQTTTTPQLHGGGEYSFAFDHGSHFFALARYLMRDLQIESVFAWSETYTMQHEGRTERYKDAPVVTWKYKNGEWGTWTRPRPHGLGYDNFGFKTIVDGTEGTMEVLGEGGATGYSGYKASPLVLHQKGEATYYRIEDRPDIVWVSEVNYYNGAHQNELDHFIRCILKDEKPRWTGEDGRVDLQLTLSMIKSSMEGKVIDVKSLPVNWTAYEPKQPF